MHSGEFALAVAQSSLHTMGGDEAVKPMAAIRVLPMAARYWAQSSRPLQLGIVIEGIIRNRQNISGCHDHAKAGWARWRMLTFYN